MSQQDLLETAEAVAGLMPRLARGLSSAEKDPADDLPLAQLRLCGILSEGPRPMSALSRDAGRFAQRLDADRRPPGAGAAGEARGRRKRPPRPLPATHRPGRKDDAQRREARVLRTLAVLERLSAPQREAVRASLEILVDACSAVQAGERQRQAGRQTKTANGHANNHHPGTPASKGSKSKVTP